MVHKVTLGNCGNHWAESFLRERGLKTFEEPDDNPLLSLVARYGLSKYACNFIRSMDSSKTIFFRAGGRSLVFRLCFWAMHHPSLKTRHLEILQSLLDAGFEINSKTPHRKVTLGDTSWEDLLYMAPGRISEQLTSLTTMSGTHTVDKAHNKNEADMQEELSPDVSLAQKFVSWIKLVLMFLRAGAELRTSLKRFGAAPEGGLATDVINDVVGIAQMQRSLCSSELAEIQITAADLLQGITGNLDKPCRPHHPQSRSQQSSRPEASVPAFYTTVDPRSRQLAVAALLELNFGMDQISRAIEQAGIGYDIAGLTTWILADQDARARARKGDQVTSSNRCPTNAAKVKVVDAHSTARQWSKVAKQGNTREQRQVVGAQYVVKPKKRRASKKSADAYIRVDADGGMADMGTNSGAFDMDCGTFTWFFEPKDSDQSIRTLSTGQQRQLQMEVESLFASA